MRIQLDEVLQVLTPSAPVVVQLVHVAVGHPGSMDAWQSQGQPSACLTARVVDVGDVDHTLGILHQQPVVGF